MKVMRSNYDKPRRCPNWSGPALESADILCNNGMLTMKWMEQRFPTFMIHQCPKCQTIVLPLVLRNLDPSWWKWRIERRKW